MSGLASASSSGAPTPESMGNPDGNFSVPQGASPDSPPPPGFRRAPIGPRGVQQPYLRPYLPPQPQRPLAAPSFTGPGTSSLSPDPTDPSLCPKEHHLLEPAPPGYHWLQDPATANDQPRHHPPQPAALPDRQPTTRQREPVPANLPPKPSNLPPKPAHHPPHALWCPITLSWYPPLPNTCYCPLLPTGPQDNNDNNNNNNNNTAWVRGSSGVPPHAWLLRPQGYDVFPAPYPTSECARCRDMGRLGLVRDGCPVHDGPGWSLR
ncbi:uncharacterized protein B0H64DRAFT_442005 [Chaetomium fimeti]|uniref:Uncharacterized protein n=1 Tax=Chaetomium fimeti TaxID=1854472 RepID=A0AAE0HFT8_9PEZI|nr:hypothetical protein B0H64DRAFT_442005 [Chaetomium fimeti]